MVTKYQVVCVILFLLVFLYLCFCIVDVLRSSSPSVKEEKSSSSHSELIKRPRIGRTYTKHLIMLTVAIVVDERKESSSAKSSMCLFFCVKTAPG